MRPRNTRPSQPASQPATKHFHFHGNFTPSSRACTATVDNIQLWTRERASTPQIAGATQNSVPPHISRSLCRRHYRHSSETTHRTRTEKNMPRNHLEPRKCRCSRFMHKCPGVIDVETTQPSVALCVRGGVSRRGVHTPQPNTQSTILHVSRMT